jgi:hypothetical protein
LAPGLIFLVYHGLGLRRKAFSSAGLQSRRKRRKPRYKALQVFPARLVQLRVLQAVLGGSGAA